MGGYRGVGNRINLGFGIQGGGSSSKVYESSSEMIADTSQKIGTVGFVPNILEPISVRLWDGEEWIIINEVWDGVTSGQTLPDLNNEVGVMNGIIYFTNLDRVYQYDGSAWVWIKKFATVSTIEYPDYDALSVVESLTFVLTTTDP